MAQKSNYDIACEVIDGKWGNGNERRVALEQAGYNASAVQSIVNCLVKDRAREREQGKFLDVEIDLSRYDGLNLKFKQKG